MILHSGMYLQPLNSEDAGAKVINYSVMAKSLTREIMINAYIHLPKDCKSGGAEEVETHRFHGYHRWLRVANLAVCIVEGKFFTTTPLRLRCQAPTPK